jgi:KAP family P-loop domain
MLLKNGSPKDTTSAMPPRVETESQELHTAPFYADHPAHQDVLNRRAVAETIATMIENVWRDGRIEKKDVDRTFMVHLHGRWGSGKTSILNFLKDALRGGESSSSPAARMATSTPGGPAWVIIDYNAWRNQKLGPAWWTLMETVLTEAREQLGGWSRSRGRALILRDWWWRVRIGYLPYWLTLTLVLSSLLLVMWAFHSVLFHQSDWVPEALKIVGSVVTFIVALFAFGHNYHIGSAKTAKSYLELSRDPLSPLIRRYDALIRQISSPVAVLIDDLDRCNADFVVELLQTMQTMFRHARVPYVVAADRDWVCASYQDQYKNVSTTIGEPGKSLGHLFIEKVFQLSIEVPHLGVADRDTYWETLVHSGPSSKVNPTNERIGIISTEIESATTEAEVIKVVDKYRDDGKAAEFAAASGFRRLHAPSLIRQREHFLRQYAHLLEPNPRAMKRLLNAYGFRRGFSIQSRTRSEPDALVRWTILENRWPILTDYLEGRSSGRNDLEIINALMKNPEVLKVAEGLTWEKLRPVASAPSEPPDFAITPGSSSKSKEAKLKN